MPSFERLDPNFVVAGATRPIAWHGAAAWRVEGRGWTDATPYARLPGRAQALVRDPVWQLGQCSAGIALSFVTDSPIIAARWRLTSARLAMDHMAATGVSGLDCHERVDGAWRWRAVSRQPATPWSEAVLVDDARDAERTWRIDLPLYNGVADFELGLAPEARVRPCPPPAASPLCIYGTSIVQGGCASRPGMAYPAILARRLDREVLNLGFSGNAQMEPELAALLAELDPAAYVLDALPNMQPEQVAARAGIFLRELRRARPSTPILLVEHLTAPGEAVSPARRSRRIGCNDALRSAVDDLARDGMEGMHLVRGDHLLGDDGEATVDGLHPTDVGFQRIAAALEPELRAVLA